MVASSAMDKRKMGRPRSSLPAVDEPNEFAVWIHEIGLTVEQVAKLVRVKPAVVYGWRKGTRKPGAAAKLNLFQVSLGDVSINGWG